MPVMRPASFFIVILSAPADRCIEARTPGSSAHAAPGKPVHIQSFVHSGRPAMLVRKLSAPASNDADNTIIQSTCESSALVPIVATAVCATVLSALDPAHFSHFLKLSILYFISLLLRQLSGCCKRVYARRAPQPSGIIICRHLLYRHSSTPVITAI